MTTSTHTLTQKPISRQCLLETEGYRIVFNLKGIEKTKTDMDLIVEYQLDPHLGLVLVKSKPEFIAVKDLQRLLNYFEEHISRLQEEPDYESYTFLTYGLSFQVQALAGEVRSPNDGEFSIRFMVNVGQTNVEASRTYVGGESVVTLANFQSFALSLQAVLTEL
jgi:hypothetical protein